MKRWWRQRGLSQLDLAVRTDLSQRHVSFIETGRSRPRAEVVNRVAEALEVPFEIGSPRWRQQVWPIYPEIPLSDEAAAHFRDTIRKMLQTHEPYPAYVINR